jgi:hypothetical protein
MIPGSFKIYTRFDKLEPATVPDSLQPSAASPPAVPPPGLLGSVEPTAPKEDDHRCSCGQSDESWPSVKRKWTQHRGNQNDAIFNKKNKNKLDFYAKIKWFWKMTEWSRTWILKFRPFLTKAAFLRSTWLWYHSVTPDFRRGTKCISYVHQDQFTHIW